MKSRKRNIILIAWLQLILLLFPTAVKALHYHHNTENKSEVVCISHGNAFAKAATTSCPICDFEFVQFVEPETVYLPDTPLSFSKLYTAQHSGVSVSAVILPSLRAPPVLGQL